VVGSVLEEEEGAEAEAEVEPPLKLDWSGAPTSLLRRESTPLTSRGTTLSEPRHTPLTSLTTTTTVRSKSPSPPSLCWPRVHHHHRGRVGSYHRSKLSQIPVNGSLPPTDGRLPTAPSTLEPHELKRGIRRRGT
jgi:hypothetical protein